MGFVGTPEEHEARMKQLEVETALMWARQLARSTV